MFKESKFLEAILGIARKIIPRPIFKFFQPIYHGGLSLLGAIFYGFPAKSLKIIGVTGTKGKSTTVLMVAKIFEEQGSPVAAIGSLGFKIKDKEWPNNLKMTMPGRFKLQKFLAQARTAGCQYVVMEVTSEGLAQNRLASIAIDCAIFTNLHREHLEAHGSFENYLRAKQKLFRKTTNRQILNIEDPYFEKFANFSARKKVTYGLKWGLMTLSGLAQRDLFLDLKIIGDFNVYNALAALAVADSYGFDLVKAVTTLNAVQIIPGRMEVIESKVEGIGFKVIIDYAHTPDSLEAVYRNLKDLFLTINNQSSKMICVLGAAGGGRDKWKRPEFGKIAERYCDEIILTNEDPYDENPEEILEQISSGFSQTQNPKPKIKKIINREKAIKTAISLAKSGDVVVITGKGSENSIAIEKGKKIPWSDKEIVNKILLQQ